MCETKMTVTFIPLEKLVVSCDRKGRRRLRHNVYYRATPDSELTLLGEAFTRLDEVVYNTVMPVLKTGRLYCTEDDYNKFYRRDEHLDK